MAASSVTSRGPDNRETLIPGESYSSGISWAAVIAGAFVAASLWLILLSLGTGLGVSSVSPWSDLSASASTIGKAAILWLIITEIIASSMGGYLAGRLRTKWATIHTDEVYFRDTAHGFLVWAVGLVITASFLASAATSMVGGVATLRSPSLSASAVADPNEYFIDRLFRPDYPGLNGIDTPARAEATRIFAHALGQGSLAAADQTYLADLIAEGVASTIRTPRRAWRPYLSRFSKQQTLLAKRSHTYRCGYLSLSLSARFARAMPRQLAAGGAG